MKEPDPASPPLDVPEYNRAAALEVIEHIDKDEFCALLGPRYAGKSDILRAVQAALSARQRVCIYIDLNLLETTSPAEFFTQLTGVIAGNLHTMTGRPPGARAIARTRGIEFRNFLEDSLARLQRDLILMFDHLEAAPHDLLQALLTSLRAAYSEQQTRPHRLAVVVCGALSLGKITVGPTSPFHNIAHTVLVGDLTDAQSRALVAAHTASATINVSPGAREELFTAARGDPYLLSRLCHKCVEAVPKRLKDASVRRLVQDFIQNDAPTYKVVQEAIRLIEDDPDLLKCIVLLLERDTAPKRELPLPLVPDLDPLYLTGMVREVGRDRYQLRNKVYRECLAHHFTPGRVGHLFVMAGRWDEAINYLADRIAEGEEQYRADLLAATVHSMFAAENLERAAHYLARGLSAGFGVKEAQIWHFDSQENVLRRIGQLGPATSSGAARSLTISPKEDGLETQAFRKAHPLRGPGNKRAAPLMVPPRQQPVGVVVINDLVADGVRQQEHELVGYLNQAARALQEVYARQKRRTLSEVLREIAVIIGESLELEKVTRMILPQLARVLPFDTASIQLFNPTSNVLEIVASRGFSDPQAVEKLVFPLEDRFPNVQVWRTKTPRRYADVTEVFPHFADPQYHTAYVRGWLGVPLVARGESLGAITLDSFTADFYTPEHENLAMVFANQTALAIENARLFKASQQRAEELSSLANVAREISASITDHPRQILDSIVRGACETTGADCAVIYPFLPGRVVYDTLNTAAYGLNHPERFAPQPRDPQTHRYLTRVVLQNGIYVVNDIATDPNAPRLKSRFLEREAIRAFVAICLSPGEGDTPGDEKPLGVLFVNFRDAHVFDEEELETIRRFASHAAIAINNARLYRRTSEALEKRGAELDKIQKIDNAIRSTLELQKILQMILNSAVEQTNAAFGTVQLVTEDGEALKFVVGTEMPVPLGDRLGFGQGITGKAAQEGRTIRVPDVTQPPWDAAYVPYNSVTRSELAVPMIFEDRVVGVINIEHPEVDAFSEEDQQLLERLAQQAAIAIHTAMRYEELQKAYKELEDTRDRMIATEAVAWLGLFGADWQHTINQKTFSIRQYVNGLRRWLRKQEALPQLAEQVSLTLDHIEEVVQGIQQVRFISQVPSHVPGETREQLVEDEAPETVEQTSIDKELSDIVTHWCVRRSDVQANLQLQCPGVDVAIPPEWLGVAMEKLVNNALKAMPDGGALTVSTKQVGDTVYIFIEDTGKGIPDFARADFLKRAIRRPQDHPGAGTGMGALIARFIAQSYKGDLALVKSVPNEGTQLLMTLPVADSQPSSARSEAARG